MLAQISGKLIFKSAKPSENSTSIRENGDTDMMIGLAEPSVNGLPPLIIPLFITNR